MNPRQPESGLDLSIRPDYTVLKISGSPNSRTLREIEDKVAQQEALVAKHMLVDCAQLEALPLSLVRALLQLAIRMKSNHALMRVVNLSDPLQTLLRSQGVTQTVVISPSMDAAMKELMPNGGASAGKKKALDVNFINPFLMATIEVLKVQTSTAATPGQIYRKDAHDRFLGDISGVIGLISPNFTGSVVISFPEQTFLKIISRMLGENYDKLSAEIADGAGELTNIIFGQAKVVLNEKGYDIQTAIPSLVMGKEHSVISMSNGPVVVIPFSTDIGDFFVEICLSA